GVAAGGESDFSYTFLQNQPSAATGGTLDLENASGDITVRQTSTATTAHMATLDLSKLSFFIANMRNINVGVGDSTNTRAMGTMWLANSTTSHCNRPEIGCNP